MMGGFAPFGVMQKTRGLPGFSRASNAWRQSNGLIAPANMPRYETGYFEEGTTNLLTANQSSIETDTTGMIGTNAVISRDTSVARWGSASLRVQPNGGATLEGAFVHYPQSPSVVVGKTYTGSVYLYAAVDISLRVVLRFVDSGNLSVADAQVIVSVPAGRWVRFFATGAAPANSVRASIMVRTEVATTTNFWMDGLQIEEKSYPTPWVLGGTTRPAITGRGALRIDEGTTNLFTNPLMRTFFNGTASGWTRMYSVSGAGFSETVGRFGRAQRCVITGSDYASAQLGLSHNPITVTPGETITASVMIERVTANPCDAAILFRDETAGITYQQSSITANSGEVITVSASTVVPAGCSSLKIYLGISKPAAGWTIGDYVIIHAAQAERKSYATPFHEGTRAAESFVRRSAGIINGDQGEVSFWFYTPTAVQNNAYVFDCRGAGNPQRILFYFTANLPAFLIGDGATSVTLTPATNPVVAGWNFACIQWGPAGAQLTVNSVSVVNATVTRGPTVLGSEIVLGTAYNLANYPVGMVYDDVRIRTVQGTLADAAALYASGRPAQADANTTLLLPFNGSPRRLVA